MKTLTSNLTLNTERRRYLNYSHHYNLPFFKQKFLRYLKRRDFAEETIVGYEKDLKMFNEFIYDEYDGNILLEQITKSDLYDYLSFLHYDKGYKQTTIQRHLSTLKSLYRFLVDEMGFKENIAAKIRHKSVYVPLPPILTIEEKEQLLSTASEYGEYFFTLISTLFYTGGRITATTQLQKKNVDFKDSKLYFPRIKGGKDLYLPIHEKLEPILENFLQNHPARSYPYVFHSPRNPSKPISPSTVRFHLRKIKKMAGIEKRVTPHIIRHTMATHLTIEGVDQRYIMAILGHSDPRATARYQQLVVENLRDPLNKLK